ncbi:ALF repeat-containing protein [Streptomyces sp. NBC_01298]|uniref:ALF repeat-containing protein n=1 Tax=Streptomyces sp. NBC_01298 TaxID=2903817 RepID=UPI002E13A665|nr:ALF repeat-containing protein [Streptomyces sp. NBC_01298]
MKLSRIAAAITTAALAPAVLLASPALATGQGAAASVDMTAPAAPGQGAGGPAGTNPDPDGTGGGAAGQDGADQDGADRAEQDRETILAIIADPMASTYMKEAGNEAIADGPAAMRTFIETDQYVIRRDDYRVLISRLANDAGPGLMGGIKEIMRSGATLDELRHFYEVTQHELRDEDNKVDISRIVGIGGPAVREAGKKALKGTPADRTAFLKTGQYLAQAADDRAELARIDEAWDGPLLSGAISEILGGSATPAELRQFLEVTQYELRDQDNRVEIMKIIHGDGAGPELVKAGRAALAGTAADRTAFLKTGQHEARAKDKKAQEQQEQGTGEQDENAPGAGSDSGSGSGTGGGNNAVTPQGGTTPPLASTGADDSTLITVGGGTALVAGAGLLLAARMRRAGSAR